MQFDQFIVLRNILVTTCLDDYTGWLIFNLRDREMSNNAFMQLIMDQVALGSQVSQVLVDQVRDAPADQQGTCYSLHHLRNPGYCFRILSIL